MHLGVKTGSREFVNLVEAQRYWQSRRGFLHLNVLSSPDPVLKFLQWIRSNQSEPAKQPVLARVFQLNLNGQIAISHSNFSSVEKRILLAVSRYPAEPEAGNNHWTSLQLPGIGLRKHCLLCGFACSLLNKRMECRVYVWSKLHFFLQSKLVLDVVEARRYVAEAEGRAAGAPPDVINP
jgi:hypothetical protein